MANLLSNAFLIAKFLFDHDYVGGNTITVGELRTRLNLSKEDFDNADIYLLESSYCDGTMGGDLGWRRLTTQGVNYVDARSHEGSFDSGEAVTAVSVVTHEPESAHILFVDLVGFSKLRLHDQQKIHEELTSLLNRVPEVLRSKNEGEVITLPTGDGAALVFSKGLKRHVDAAIALGQAVQKNPAIKVRMGLHSGPVQRVVDVNGNTNVVGPGINMAQRVMDCGDENHILVSKEVADTLTEVGGFDELLEDLGLTKVKHDREIHLYNLRGANFGNSSQPSRFGSAKALFDDVIPQTDPSSTKPDGKDVQVLLTTSEGKATIIRAERVAQGETLTLSLVPSDHTEVSFLRDLRSHSHELIGVAYGNIGMHARVRSISSVLERSKDLWTLEVEPFDGDYRGGALGEMALGKFSADDIAVMRARRILLNEKLPTFSTAQDETTELLNSTMLEVFVEGVNTHVKIKGSSLPYLFEATPGDINSFLVAAKLFSVLWLHVSGVVDSIKELELKMVGESDLEVRFEGRRPRTYVNVEPFVIKIEGICNLTGK